MTGTVASVSEGLVKLSHGKSPDSSHDVDPDAKVTLNGKACKLPGAGRDGLF